MEIPANDIILEEMGQRVADMDHLVAPVLEEITEKMKMLGTDEDWYQDFVTAVEDLKNEYHENGATGRYFVADTIIGIVEREAEDG